MSEWIGAIVTMPSYVTDEGAPYRPSILLWLDADSGMILGNELVKPGAELANAARVFRETTQKPHEGPPRTPTRVRVSTNELADALRGAIENVQVVVAPTPEINEFIESMQAHLGDGAVEATMLSPSVTPDVVSSFFAAAAELFDAQPWEVVPADRAIGVACESLDIDAGVLFVVGQAGESFGFGLFRTHEDAQDYLEAVEHVRPGRRPTGIPAHIMFNFDRRDSTPDSIQREVAAHGWKLARPDAYPTAVMLEPDLVTRPLTREELSGVTAVIQGLAELVRAYPDLGDAWGTGQVVSHQAKVRVPTGTATVELTAPLWLDPDEEELALLEHRTEDFLDRLTRHPSAQGDELGWAEMLVHCAIDHFGALLHELSPEELTALLFEIVPAKVPCKASDARVLARSLGLVLTYAAHQPNPGRARQLLGAIPPDTISRLEGLLANPRNFGPTKKLILDGTAAGFDMGTEAGIAEYLATVSPPPARRKAKKPAAAKAKAPKKKAPGKPRKR